MLRAVAWFRYDATDDLLPVGLMEPPPLGAVLLGYSVLDVPQMALALEMAHAQRMGQEALAVES